MNIWQLMNKKKKIAILIAIEILVLSIAILSIVIGNPHYQFRKELLSQIQPHLKVEIKDEETFRRVICLQDQSTPGLWPIGGEIHLIPGSSYEFSVIGSSQAEARLLIADVSGNPIHWPGPFLPINKDTVSINFSVTPKVNAVTLGILFPSPVINAEFGLYQITLLEKNDHQLTSGLLALIFFAGTLAFYFTTRWYLNHNHF